MEWLGYRKLITSVSAFSKTFEKKNPFPGISVPGVVWWHNWTLSFKMKSATTSLCMKESEFSIYPHWDGKYQAFAGTQTLKTKTGSGKSDLPWAQGGAGDRLWASTSHWWWMGAVCWLLGGPHDLTWWSPSLAARGPLPETEMSRVPRCPFAQSKRPRLSYMSNAVMWKFSGSIAFKLYAGFW